ncbi:hypothetical protein [Gimesia fumaroli]|uniref:Uncharacterized protein n=1 Tax=Gimesia fumaroli TaxID=2527976 RepID=A0A518IIK5_9PLAN|nr:hypothetical protein [Gimesia fumaroli]QDV52925.1 hypothetical protein Enr17x_49950 [Gimesia fumaroli]
MSTRFLFNICWCALISCAASGCYSHHQYPYGGTYPGPYGTPGPYEMAPGSIPPGSYPVQPDLGQPVPPPQGSLPPTGSQAYSDQFPSNTTNNTNYDGVDSQWKQPVNSSPGPSSAPFESNPTASGRNATPSSGLNQNSTGSQAVPSYQDPNKINSNPQSFGNEFPQNTTPPSSNTSNSFPGNANDEFESNQTPQPLGGNSTQMNDQFEPSSNDQFQSNPPDQFQQPKDEFQQNDNEGFSVPKVEQQSFESDSDTFGPNNSKMAAPADNDVFGANPQKFEANPMPKDSFDANPSDPFNVNPNDSSQEFQPPVNSFPGNDDTFGPNSSSMMNSAPGKVSHAGHQSRASGPQLVQSDPFMKPAKFQSASFEVPSDSGQRTSAGKSPSPFNYDKQNYRWLRGIVEFDEQEKRWNITYNAIPDKSDRFGGNIVLIDQGQLNRFTNGDVVLIDGHIDGSQQDKMGKPCYRIAKAQKLVPKK